MSVAAPISKQIFSISKSLIAGLLVLSALAIATTLVVRSTFIDYRVTARTTLTAGAIFGDLFEARVAAIKWRLSPDDAYIEDFLANIEELRKAESELETLYGPDSQMVQKFSSLDAELSEYEAQFKALLDARADFDAVEAELETVGLEARKALTEIMTSAHRDGDATAAFYAGRAQEAVMLGRFYVERFRRSGADGDLTRAVSETETAMEELQALRAELQNPRRIDLVQQTIENLDIFTADSAKLATSLQAQRAAQAVMDELGPKIIADVQAVIEAAKVQQNTLGPRGQAISFWAVLAICVAALIIIALGWRISKKLSARISGDIENAVSAMTRIADGDLDAHVDNADSDNEIGRMAKALEVFKANGKAAIEANEREQAAEQERLQAAEEQKQKQEQQEEKAREQAEAARQEMIAELSRSLGQVVNAASDGDFSQRVDAEFSDAQLSTLANNVNKLVQSVEEGVTAAGHALERVAEGDLTKQMDGEFKGAFKDLQDNTNQMIGSLKALIGEISGSTTNLASSSNELRDTSDGLSKQAEQNAASLEETSAALEELTASIKQVSDSVTEANDNASVASDTAKSSSVVAADAAEAMNRISEASKEIAKVVTVINDIAFQINLLALNAGVEAARAGEAGQGFSVVASEVRQLAQRAGEAAREIEDVIERSDNAVTEGVAKVTNAQESLEEISERVVGVSERIDQISNAISEQVNGISEINGAVALIDSNTQKQAASFEEVTAASGLLSNEAEGLERSTARFNTGNEVLAFKPAKKAPVAQAPRAETTVPSTAGNLAEDLNGWDEF